jgi:hypothetical protein
MAIDFVVDYGCDPKRKFGTPEILERLKMRVRAQTIIRLFREHGDSRPPSEMGFEFVRQTPEGEEETQIIIVQDLLDRATELDEWGHHCAGCAANARNAPFGCVDAVQYPLSARGERWLLDRLPGIDAPFLWLLLRQGIQEMGYDGEAVKGLRASGTYFEADAAMTRDMQDFIIDTNQVFEMTFMLGDIQPAHAGMLLQFFNAVPRTTEASQVVEIMNGLLSADEIAQRYPLRITDDEADDSTIAELKRFLRALHLAWRLRVPLILDA